MRYLIFHNRIKIYPFMGMLLGLAIGISILVYLNKVLNNLDLIGNYPLKYYYSNRMGSTTAMLTGVIVPIFTSLVGTLLGVFVEKIVKKYH